MNAKIFTKLIKSAFAALLIVSLVGIASCEKTEEPEPTPEPQPAKYTIRGQVINQETNAALPGVLVTMGTLSQTTTATGSFEFANLTTAGKYTMVFTKANFFPATYSLEFQAAAPNHTLIYTITASMVPYVPGITPLDPVAGGVVPITGGLTATLTVPASTVVKDANGATVTGTIKITAVTTPDIVIAGTVHNPAVMALRLEPSGYQFSKPLPIAIRNPLTGFRYSQMQLEYFNNITNLWEVQTQAVTFNATANDYLTSVTHFSLYKVAFKTPVTQPLTVSQTVEVTDSSISNTSLVNVQVSKIRYKRKSGYVFETPVLTALSAAGITGADATTLAAQIVEIVKGHYSGVAALSQLAVVSAEENVSRTILPNYKLRTTGVQNIVTEQFTIQLTKLSDNTTKTVIVKTNTAGLVTLTFQDISLSTHDHHDHGSGGGGTN